MDKAYDFKDLAKKLQSKGLNVAEEGAKEAYFAIKEWFKESAVLSSTPFDNMVIPFMDQIDAIVLEQLDKIDGQEG